MRPQIPSVQSRGKVFPPSDPITDHLVTLSKNNQHDKWTLSLRHETWPAVSVLVNFYCFYFYVNHYKSPCCQCPKTEDSWKPHFKNNTSLGKAPSLEWREWQSFDGSTDFFLPQEQSNPEIHSLMESCRVEDFCSPGIHQLAFILQAPIGSKEKMQIINPEVNHISPQTPPAGLTNISQNSTLWECLTRCHYWLVTPILLGKPLATDCFKGGLIIRDEVFSCFLSKFVNWTVRWWDAH